MSSSRFGYASSLHVLTPSSVAKGAGESRRILFAMSFFLAPRNAAEFDALCASLRRNDPSNERVSVDAMVDVEEGYGHQLGVALRDNTVVSVLAMNLVGYESHLSNQDGGPLLEWISTSPSLQSVQLFAVPTTGDQSEASVVAIQQRILVAVAANPGISKFKSSVWNFPLADYTVYWTNATWLESLDINVDGNEDTNEQAVDVAAQAIAALPNLRVLSIEAMNIRPFLRRLQATTRLLDLTVSFRDFARPNADNVQLLTTVWSNNPELQRVGLADMKLDDNCWQEIEQALSSHPSITQVYMNHCYITVAAGMALVDYMGWNAQPIRDLNFSNCTLLHVTHPSMAMMLCGDSPVRHFTLDMDTVCAHLQPALGTEFFATLRVNAATVRLESLTLKRINHEVLLDLAGCLPQLRHLRKLTFQHGRVGRILSLPDGEQETAAREAFLSSVRRNGSLHEICIEPGGEHFQEGRTWRFIKACTDRNRFVPQVMAGLPWLPGNNGPNGNHGLLGLMGLASMQAEQMTLHTWMVGLTVPK